MKIDVLRVVTRGAAPRTRCCEGCRQAGHALRECRIPSSTHSCYWRDLCPRCIARLKTFPALPGEKKRADAAWDKALQQLEERK